MSAAAELAETAWHERLRRRLHPDAMDARLRGLAHELLAVASAQNCSEEAVERETRRVLDELGTAVGIGPMPC